MKGPIFGTLLVRDEEDIIEECLEHHFANGIERMIVTDNGSIDKTKEIVASYSRVIEIIDEPSKDFQQDVWVTRMARRAYRLGAAWVLNIDADEFWYGAKLLNNVQEDVTEIRVNHLYNHVPTTDISSFSREKFPYYTKPATRGKTIHRASPDVQVALGNHRIKGLQGKRIHDPTGFFIHHYPVRSLAQFTKKCRNAGSLDNGMAKSSKSPWAALWNAYKTETVVEYYTAQLYTPEHIKEALAKGELFDEQTSGLEA